MPSVVVVCSDLMTSSRFGGAGYEVVVVRRPEAFAERVNGMSPDLLLLDLLAVPVQDIPALRAQLPGTRCVGFAPHVHEELMQDAREHCDEVLPRGAIVRRWSALADAAAEG